MRELTQSVLRHNEDTKMSYVPSFGAPGRRIVLVAAQ